MAVDGIVLLEPARRRSCSCAPDRRCESENVVTEKTDWGTPVSLSRLETELNRCDCKPQQGAGADCSCRISYDIEHAATCAPELDADLCWFEPKLPGQRQDGELLLGAVSQTSLFRSRPA